MRGVGEPFYGKREYQPEQIISNLREEILLSADHTVQTVPGQTGFTEQPAIFWKSLRLAESVNSAEIGKNQLCTLIQDGHIGPK